MAALYPVAIPDTISGYDIQNSPFGQFLFETGGSIYAFLCQGGGNTPFGDFKVHALKSDDDGVTWVEQDSANAADVGGVTGFGAAYTVLVDGDTVLVMNVAAHFSSPNVILDGFSTWTYSLSSDTWTSGPVSITSVVPGFMERGFSSQLSRQVFLQLVLVSTGNYLLYYSSDPEVVGGNYYARCSVVDFDGATMGTPVAIPDQAGNAFYYFPNTCWQDSAGSHFVYMDNFAVGAFNVYHVSYDGATFGTTQTVSTSGYLNGEAGSVSNAVVYSVASVEVASFAVFTNVMPGFTSQSITVYTAATAVDPTWTDSIAITDTDLPIDGLEDFFVTPLMMDLIVQDDTLFIAWTTQTGGAGNPLANGSGQFFVISAPTGSLVWGTQELLFDSLNTIAGNKACQIKTVALSGNRVGYLGISLSNGADGSFPPPDTNDMESAEFFTEAAATTPACTLSASSISINFGQSTTLSWSTTGDPTSAIIDHGVGSVDPAGGSTIVTPLTSLTYHLIVSNEQGVSSCEVTITVIATGFEATCNGATSGVVGVGYIHTFTVSGGTPPYTWAVVGGALPPGLTLNAASGTVSGVPTTIGVYFFTLQATDANGAIALVSCTIPIACP